MQSIKKQLYGRIVHRDRYTGRFVSNHQAELEVALFGDLLTCREEIYPKYFTQSPSMYFFLVLFLLSLILK